MGRALCVKYFKCMGFFYFSVCVCVCKLCGFLSFQRIEKSFAGFQHPTIGLYTTNCFTNYYKQTSTITTTITVHLSHNLPQLAESLKKINIIELNG